jgi:hypothetical protein
MPYQKRRKPPCTIALYFLYYNFVRIHKTLKVTPAMAAALTDRLWKVAERVNILEAWEAQSQGRLAWINYCPDAFKNAPAADASFVSQKKLPLPGISFQASKILLDVLGSSKLRALIDATPASLS